MSTSLVMGSLVILAVIALTILGVVARRWGRPKTEEERRDRMRAYSERGLPSAVEELGRGIVFPGDAAAARQLVETHLASKPKRFVAQPDGSWAVPLVAADDLVIELVSEPVVELRVRSFRDHTANPPGLAEWRVLKMDLESKARKAGIGSEAGATREFARHEQAGPDSWRWLPV